MSCENNIGLKNAVFSFTHCDTGEQIKRISHVLAEDDLPEVRMARVSSETLNGGYVKKTQGSPMIKGNFVRDRRVPQEWYEGHASIDVQLEYYSGIIISGVGGTNVAEDGSDTHSVNLEITYRQLDELLPDGALAQA